MAVGAQLVSTYATRLCASANGVEAGTADCDARAPSTIFDLFEPEPCVSIAPPPPVPITPNPNQIFKKTAADAAANTASAARAAAGDAWTAPPCVPRTLTTIPAGQEGVCHDTLTRIKLYCDHQKKFGADGDLDLKHFQCSTVPASCII